MTIILCTFTVTAHQLVLVPSNCINTVSGEFAEAVLPSFFFKLENLVFLLLLNVLRAAAEDLFYRVFRALRGLPSLSLAGKHNPAAARPLLSKAHPPSNPPLPGGRVHFYWY